MPGKYSKGNKGIALCSDNVSNTVANKESCMVMWTMQDLQDPGVPQQRECERLIYS